MVQVGGAANLGCKPACSRLDALESASAGRIARPTEPYGAAEAGDSGDPATGGSGAWQCPQITLRRIVEYDGRSMLYFRGIVAARQARRPVLLGQEVTHILNHFRGLLVNHPVRAVGDALHR